MQLFTLFQLHPLSLFSKGYLKLLKTVERLNLFERETMDEVEKGYFLF